MFEFGTAVTVITFAEGSGPRHMYCWKTPNIMKILKYAGNIQTSLGYPQCKKCKCKLKVN